MGRQTWIYTKAQDNAQQCVIASMPMSSYSPAVAGAPTTRQMRRHKRADVTLNVRGFLQISVAAKIYLVTH